MKRRFYAALWFASEPVAVEQCVVVRAFATRRERDAYVSLGRFVDAPLRHSAVRGSARKTRESLSRGEAARYINAIMRGAVGGLHHGYENLDAISTMSSADIERDDRQKR